MHYPKKIDILFSKTMFLEPDKNIFLGKGLDAISVFNVLYFYCSVLLQTCLPPGEFESPFPP